jgi:hypothetical protein
MDDPRRARHLRGVVAWREPCPHVLKRLVEKAPISARHGIFAQGCVS